MQSSRNFRTIPGAVAAMFAAISMIGPAQRHSVAGPWPGWSQGTSTSNPVRQWLLFT